MGKLFGTDGIRGIAGSVLTAELALKVGRATAKVLIEDGFKKPLVLIGKDTRISSDMLENALAAGLCSAGADVMLLGVIPTPAVACLSIRYGAAAGVVISASHNPYEHNGIKIFGGNGYKLSDEMEDRIEGRIYENEAAGPHFGRIMTGQSDPRGEYIRQLLSAAEGGFGELRAVIDCANGAASGTAPELFSMLGLHSEFMFCSPNGRNINDGCGSTDMAALRRRVTKGGFDIGIAFDGDADRCLIVDEKGNLVDGDKMMGVCALYERKKGYLPGHAVVATVMSNLGLHNFCKANGLTLLCTDVGDRHVLEKMLEGGYTVGGEQSGHLIFSRYATTGDGQLAALRFLQVLHDSGKTVSELVADIPDYPQVLLNVAVSGGNDEKERIMSNPELQAAIEGKERELEGRGRILVRPSGTELIIRVMVEAETEAAAQNTAEEIVSVIKRL